MVNVAANEAVWLGRGGVQVHLSRILASAHSPKKSLSRFYIRTFDFSTMGTIMAEYVYGTLGLPFGMKVSKEGTLYGVNCLGFQIGVRTNHRMLRHLAHL